MLNRRQLFRAAAGAAASTMVTRIPNVFAAAPAKYDVIVKGGRVIDPAAKLNAIRDVAIAGGRIAAVKKPAPRPINMNATTGWRAMIRSSAAISQFWRYRV